jgi:hypothetical protein
LYDTVPSSGKPVAALVTNTNNTTDQGSFYERPQGLATGSLYLYDEGKTIDAQPVVLSGNNGVLSINGTPYNGGGATSTFSTLTTKELLVPAGANPDSGFFTTNTTAVRDYGGGNLTTLTLSLTGLVPAPTFTNLALGKLLVGGNTEASGSSNCAIIGAEPSTSLGVGGLSLNANGVYMGQTIISSISGLGGGGNPYQTKFIDYTNGSTITMAQLVSSVIG